MQGQDDNGLDRNEFRLFFRELMGDNYSDEAVNEAFDEIAIDGNGKISLAEFKEGILKSNKNKSSGLPRKHKSHHHLLQLEFFSDFIVDIIHEHYINSFP